MGAFARFERHLIRERQRKGITFRKFVTILNLPAIGPAPRRAAGASN